MGDSANPFGTTVLLPPDYMVGAIILWSGLVSAIPAHWQLCDGTNGTPDLRNRFIKSALNDGDVNDTGGAVNHNHPFTGDGHSHSLGGFPVIAAGADVGGTAQTENVTGTTDNADGQPPWYKLAYIQRISL